jgi:hypothetical protein
MNIRLSKMNNYCIAGSPSIEFQCENDINLQLYSLQKAAEDWNDLIYLIEKTQGVDVNQRKEKLVFILCCFAISLSQLLGQNSPSPDDRKIDGPEKLLEKFITKHNVDDYERKRLVKQSKKFIKYYNAAHHFGLNRGNKQHKIIDQLTVEELDKFRYITIKIWDDVIKLIENGKIKSIAEFVFFADLPNNSIKCDAINQD